MAKKIDQNENEDIHFAEQAEQLDKILYDNDTLSNPLKIEETPNSLVIAGADKNIDVVITSKVIKKCILVAS